MKILAPLLLIIIALFTGCERQLLGEVEFFGYKGFNIDAIRMALPFREGDVFPPSGVKSSGPLKQIIGDVVMKSIGHAPTDIAFVCCDVSGRFMIYIGLPGESSQTVVFNPAPTGDVRLPEAAVKLSEDLDKAWAEGALKGQSTKDDSLGYALSNYPPARTMEPALREYALQNEELILRVLTSSSDASHRAIAAQALGYSRQSNEQVDALVTASFDSDEGVRNDAIRALGVLAGAKPDLGQRIPVKRYVQLLRSGWWSDHNKAILLLTYLTQSRDSGVLQELRAEALDSLVEMARWRNKGHAEGARIILGRIAGIEEKRFMELIESGQIETILVALNAAR